MFNEDCQHEIIDNVCQKCNLVIENFFDKKYTNIENARDTNKYSIIDQLEGIPPEVIKLAKTNIIRKQNETGRKIRNDKKQTFIQVYEAIVELRLNIDPNIVTKQLGLGKKETNWCIKEVTQTSLIPSVHEEVNKQISIVILTPIAYIPDLCKNNNILEYKDKLIKITKDILDKKDILYSSKPEYVACGIVKKFCMKEKEKGGEKDKINIKSFSRKNNISDNALKKAMNDVEEFF